MSSRLKALANRSNAQRSTGPKTTRGKLASSQNSRKHGLNVQVDFESSDDYTSLKSLLAEEGYSPFVAAAIAAGLLNYRRVMDAYYDTYTSPEPGNELILDMSVKDSLPIFRAMLSEWGSESSEARRMESLFAGIRKQEHDRGGHVSRRTADTHKLMRYQRNGISRLSKAVRQD
jgi:hypothetical protein